MGDKPFVREEALEEQEANKKCIVPNAEYKEIKAILTVAAGERTAIDTQKGMNTCNRFPAALEDRLKRQLDFLLEVDRLKEVYRQSYLLSGGRHENSAEHSWHLAIAALLLAEHANQTVDISHVMRMVLIHDLVEIDAGDTFIYDTDGNLEKAVKEQKAAERIFGILGI
ncbi:MAG TPA: HD domain-containing protein [Chthoniobacterales bacterium]|nr:HD domain-containing protein [Chthoniobacterales bacterium]